MTYAETTVGQTIDRLLSEHPGLDPSADSALDNLDQVHIGGADAVGLLIGSLALAEGDRVLDIGSGLGGPARQMARRTGNRVTGIDITPPTSTPPATCPRSTPGRLGEIQQLAWTRVHPGARTGMVTCGMRSP
jgi:SAM-dependent methyltransferase